MHVVTRRRLKVFSAQYPESEEPLDVWYRHMRRGEFHTWGELRAAFPTADKVDDKIVFNIGGNKYRLVVVIHFNREVVFVRNVLTHQDYDKGKWTHG